MPETIGLAKAAPEAPKTSPEEAITPPPKPMEVITAPSWEGIPIDTIRYFGQDIGTITQRTIEQLRDINDWSKTDLLEDTIGNRLQKIRGLESKLGAPALYETKIIKMWNWVKMQANINELRKRQEAFER